MCHNGASVTFTSYQLLQTWNVMMTYKSILSYHTYTNPLVGYIIIIISPFVTRTLEGDTAIISMRGVRNTSPSTVASGQYKLSSVLLLP